MVFYTIPIPEPKICGQYLAVVRSNHVGRVDVFWNRIEAQTLFHVHQHQKWFIQPNTNIRTSLAAILDCLERDIQFTTLDVQEGDNDYEANDDTRSGFLDCEWSDFANDYMSVDVCVIHPIYSKYSK